LSPDYEKIVNAQPHRMPERLEDESEKERELAALARNAKGGDLRAFEELVKLYQGRIHANCRYISNDASNAEDLAQEVFVRAYFALPKYEGRSTFRHWLQRIKVNHCLNHLKRDRAARNVVLDESLPEQHEQLRTAPQVTADLEREADRKRIDEVLRAMSPTLRVPLIMRDMDELSYEELSSNLGVSLSAAKMRVKRAREQFRTLYMQQQESG
jgi:RNA polymerase sigma-70 factor, ECF subfamily